MTSAREDYKSTRSASRSIRFEARIGLEQSIEKLELEKNNLFWVYRTFFLLLILAILFMDKESAKISIFVGVPAIIIWVYITTKIEYGIKRMLMISEREFMRSSNEDSYGNSDDDFHYIDSTIRAFSSRFEQVGFRYLEHSMLFSSYICVLLAKFDSFHLL